MAAALNPENLTHGLSPRVAHIIHLHALANTQTLYVTALSPLFPHGSMDTILLSDTQNTAYHRSV